MTDQAARIDITVATQDKATPGLTAIQEKTQAVTAGFVKMSGATSQSGAEAKELGATHLPFLGQAFEKLSEHGAAGAGNIRRITSSLAGMAISASEVPQPLARIVEGVAQFAGGHLAVLGLAVAVAGVSLAVRALSGDFSEHTKELKEAVKTYQALVEEQDKHRRVLQDHRLLIEAVTEAQKLENLSTLDHLRILFSANIAQERLNLLSEHAEDASRRLHENTLHLNEQGLRRVQQLTDESAQLQGRTKLEGEIATLLREQPNTNPVLIERIRVLADANDALRIHRDRQLSAAEAAAEQARALYGNKAAADAAQIALEELKARQAGLSDVEVTARGRLEALRLERERHLAVLREETQLTEQQAKLSGQTNLDAAISRAGATGADADRIRTQYEANAALREHREAQLADAESAVELARAMYGTTAAADAAQLSVVRLKAQQEGLTRSEVDARVAAEQLRLERQRQVQATPLGLDATRDELSQRFANQEAPGERLKRAIGDNINLWKKYQSLVASGMDPTKAIAAIEQIKSSTVSLKAIAGDFAKAFSSAFTALVFGAAEHDKSFKKFLADVSKQEAAYEFAKGVAAIAAGTWPPNPVALHAAAKHFEASALFGVLAAAGGGGGSGGGGGGGGSAASTSSGFSSNQQQQQTNSVSGLANQLTLIIPQGIVGSPAWMEELQDNLDNLGGRRLITRQGSAL